MVWTLFVCYFHIVLWIISDPAVCLMLTLSACLTLTLINVFDLSALNSVVNKACLLLRPTSVLFCDRQNDDYSDHTLHMFYAFLLCVYFLSALFLNNALKADIIARCYVTCVFPGTDRNRKFTVLNFGSLRPSFELHKAIFVPESSILHKIHRRTETAEIRVLKWLK